VKFRIILSLLLVGILASACEYQTIGSQGLNPPASNGASNPAGIKAAPTSRPKPTATDGSPVYCRLADLTPAATWNVSGPDLVGSLTLTNYWEAACVLKGQPDLGITDERGVPFVIQVSSPPINTLAPPTWAFKQNTVGEVKFTWRNYCGPAPQGTLRITVALAGQSGPALYVVVEDPNGTPMLNIPNCTNKDNPSTLTVEALRILN
jgi:hypothetical protein